VCGYLQLHADSVKLRCLKPEVVEDDNPGHEDVESGGNTD
jgi:hypothetical protein